MHIDVLARSGSAGSMAALPYSSLSGPSRCLESIQAVVYVVDADEEARLLLAHWLSAAGMRPEIYASLHAFLRVVPAEAPACLVLDALPLKFPEEARSLAVRCPIVVIAHQADVATAVRAMKTGAVDFVEKPLREQEIVAAVCAALEVDRKQRMIAARHADVRSKFATLSLRERQVMALVTAGKLNKQVAGDLGLSEITVKAHRGAAMRKMGARTLADLVRMADALGDALLG